MQCKTHGCSAHGAIDVVTALDCAMIGRSDEDHLRHTSSDGRVLYSFNIRDYSSPDAQWDMSGQKHARIILAFQQRYSVGEQMRRLLHLLNRRPSAEMESRLEYLSAWGR